MYRKVICALDTADLDRALSITRRLAPIVGGFKIGHALTLPSGLDILEWFKEAGAQRVFLDLKFHDIPNSVALAVREAARRGVWAMTLHISGGPAMMTAALEESRSFGVTDAPLLLGVSVLTSLDEHMLKDHLGVQRTLEEHMVSLSKLAIECGMDGLVCSPNEVKMIREAVGPSAVLVTPGIRLPHASTHDQRRVGEAKQAIDDGADYLVIGRMLTDAEDPEALLAQLGIED